MVPIFPSSPSTLHPVAKLCLVSSHIRNYCTVFFFFSSPKISMSPGCKNLLIWFNILIQTYLTIVTKRNNCCNRIVLFIKKKLFLKKSTSRNSHPEVFYKKGVLRNFEKFTGKHLCQSLFFDKVALQLY